MLGRLWIFAAILGGVIFFSNITTEILDLSKHEETGLGRYNGAKGANRHVLVMGGGVASGAPVNVRGFLNSLIGSGRNKHDVPEVLFMARTTCSRDMRALFNEPWVKKMKVYYFVGYYPSQSSPLPSLSHASPHLPPHATREFLPRTCKSRFPYLLTSHSTSRFAVPLTHCATVPASHH